MDDMRGNNRHRTVLLTAAFFAAILSASLFTGIGPGYSDNSLTPEPLPREETETQASVIAATGVDGSNETVSAQRKTISDALQRTATTQAYVNVATGNNGNGGTVSAPWKTISYALEKATPASSVVINVAPGTYPENFAAGQTLLVKQDNTVLQNYGTGDVVLDSGGVVTSTSTLDIGGFNNVAIVGLKFINRPQGYGISGWGASTGQNSVYVNNCYFQNMNGGVSMINDNGSAASQISQVHIGPGCTFNNVPTPLLLWGCNQVTVTGLSITYSASTVQGDGIWVGTFDSNRPAQQTSNVSITNSSIWGTMKGISFTDTTGGLIEQNTISNCFIHHVGIFNSSPTIDRNTIIGNPASDYLGAVPRVNNGILLSAGSAVADVSGISARSYPRQASKTRVRRAPSTNQAIQTGMFPPLVQNNFIDSASYGMETYGNSKIYNNTIVNNQPSPFGFEGKGIYVGDGAPDIKYNIIYNYTDFGIYSNPTITSDYNDIISPNGAGYGGSVTPGPHSFGINPKFASPQSAPSTSDNYRLTDLSPCIDATDQTATGIDLSGSPRPFGQFWDMGCYEYGSPVTFKLPVTGGTSAANYVMITIPLTISPNDIISVLTPTFGPYVPSSWRVFRYYPGSLSYIEAPLVPAVEPGVSYFLISANSATINITGNPGPAVRILTIPPGWNMIGNPYRYSLSVDNIMVSADGVSYVSMTQPTQTLTNKTFWQWAGGPNYVAGSVISPGGGGFLKNITGTNIFVKFSPIPATPFDRKRTTLVGDQDLTAGEDRPPAPPGSK
ncbi:MAG: hypothetical protein HQK59_05400 [Deltaproteobacteria bacterium]|nr:hypothetical protein [Deltaproteobacteria bacterium]